MFIKPIKQFSILIKQTSRSEWGDYLNNPLLADGILPVSSTHIRIAAKHWRIYLKFISIDPADINKYWQISEAIELPCCWPFLRCDRYRTSRLLKYFGRIILMHGAAICYFFLGCKSRTFRQVYLCVYGHHEKDLLLVGLFCLLTPIDKQRLLVVIKVQWSHH